MNLDRLMPPPVAGLSSARRFAARHGNGRSFKQIKGVRHARLDLVPVPLDEGLIVDVGANDGGWSQAVLDAIPTARVLALEPGEEPKRILQERFAGNPRITVDGRAASDTTGRAVLNTTGHSHNTSLRRPVESRDTPDWQVVDSSEIDTVALDDLIDEDVALLKIDVQGAEREVLAGATRTALLKIDVEGAEREVLRAAPLARTRAILIEVTFISHYEGDASFAELHGILTGHGFRLVELAEPTRLPSGELSWSDACYVR